MKSYRVSSFTRGQSGHTLLQGYVYYNYEEIAGYGNAHSLAGKVWRNSQDVNASGGYSGYAWGVYVDAWGEHPEASGRPSPPVYTEHTVVATFVSDLLAYENFSTEAVIESDLNAYDVITTYATIESDINVAKAVTTYAAIESDLNAVTTVTTAAIIESDLVSYEAVTTVAILESDLVVYTAYTSYATLESDLNAATAVTTAAVIESDLNAYRNISTFGIFDSDINVYANVTTYGAIESDLNIYSSVSTFAVVESDLNIFVSVLSFAALESDLNAYAGQYAVAVIESDLLADDAYYTWVINLETGAVSKYEDFNFNSISRRFACRSDGIYSLGGTDNNGANISSYVETGKMDFADPMPKRVSDMYYAKDGGKLDVFVDADNTGYVKYRDYTTTQMETVKQNLGRGARGRYWQLKVQNINGSDAVVGPIDVVVDKLNRRI